MVFKTLDISLQWTVIFERGQANEANHTTALAYDIERISRPQSENGTKFKDKMEVHYCKVLILYVTKYNNIS